MLWINRFQESAQAAAGGGWGVALLVLAHIACSLPYLATLPTFNWPDEPAHFNYVKGIAEGRGLDRMNQGVWAPAELERLKADHFEGIATTGPEIERFRYEAHQPPLYYTSPRRSTGSSQESKPSSCSIWPFPAAWWS